VRPNDLLAETSHLILDYFAMCEKFGPLDFETFTEVWTEADLIARAGVANALLAEHAHLDELAQRIERINRWFLHPVQLWPRRFSRSRISLICGRKSSRNFLKPAPSSPLP
jgi:hypothetical protein